MTVLSQQHTPNAMIRRSISFFTLCLCVVLLSSDRARGQSLTMYPSLSYPRSIISSGMGEQGAAMRDPIDAMQYNPANLIYTKNVSVSFFQNAMLASDLRRPLISPTLSLKIADGFCMGWEYINWNEGSFPITTEEYPDGNGKSFKIYEGSVSAAAAVALGKGWSAGAQVRCAWEPIMNNYRAHVLVSAGTSYAPASLADRATFGLSFMSFSTPVEPPGLRYFQAGSTVLTTPSYPTPAQINLAADVVVIHQPFFDVTAALGFTKAIDKMEDDNMYVAQSSFTSLFTDWKDFPQDVTTHIGLGYQWKPLPLGGGISFFQEMYAGYFTVGSHSSPSSDGPFSVRLWPQYTSFFTHGLRAGITMDGISVSAGYAGRWHDNTKTYSSAVFPDETYQLTVSSDGNVFTRQDDQVPGTGSLHGIVLSGGYAYCAGTGRMNGADYYGNTDAFSVRSLWSAEADFYLDDKSAIVSSLGYERMTETLRHGSQYSWLPNLDADIETAALESGFRYHPIASRRTLFVQASLGIMWLNPLSEILRGRYFYTAFDDIVIGWMIPVEGTKLIVMPKAGLKTLFLNALPYSEKLGGYNQFEFGVNIGCSL